MRSPKKGGKWRASRPWLWAFSCLFVLGVVATLAQVADITPINPLTLTPQTIQPTYLWNAGTYGVDAVSIDGNSTVYGHTLLLNTVTTDAPAAANYTLSFIDLKDLRGYVSDFTLYVPASLIFASNETPLVVVIGGETFRFFPTQEANYSWYPRNPAYIPASSDQMYLPPSLVPNGGNYLFLAFSFTSSSLANNQTVSISISVPSNGQIYIPDLILSANASSLANVESTSRWVGLLTLPATVAAIGAVYFLLRRFDAWRFAGTLAAGFWLRIGLAPLWMHSDVSTMIRFSHLYFNFGLVNLQTWSYGLVWLVSIILPVAPSYAAGVNPSFAEWDLLLKIPGIIADLLTFLVLVKILTPRLGPSRAYQAAAIGWLFNPLVVYFSAVHGLGESVVALFLSLAVYGLYTNRGWGGVWGGALAVLTIISTIFVVPFVFLSRRISHVQRAFLVLGPLLAYVVTFLVLYQSLNGFVSYFQFIGLRTNGSSLSLGASTLSPMTYLFSLNWWFGLYVSPIVGFCVVGVVAILAYFWGVEWFPRYTLVALYASMAAFYFSYEVFYVQHLIWALPLMVGTVLLAPRVQFRAGVLFAFSVSVLAFVINLLDYRYGNVDTVLSFVLFACLAVPVFIWLPIDWLNGRWVSRFSFAVRSLGAALALFLCYSLLSVGPALRGDGLMAGVVAVALLATSLPTRPDRPGASVASFVSTFGLGLAIVVPLFLLYAVPHSVSTLEILSIFALVTCGLWELARIILEVLLPIRIPVLAGQLDGQ